MSSGDATDLLTIDMERKVVSITVADWPWSLKNFLKSYFKTDQTAKDWDVLEIDFSHLSTKLPESDGWRTKNRPEQKWFLEEITKAAGRGALELVIAIFGDLEDKIRPSSSVSVDENRGYPRSQLIDAIFEARMTHLTPMMIEEGSLSSTWLPWVLSSKETRQKFLQQDDVTDAVFARVDDANGFWNALRLLQPGWQEDGAAFAKAADLHWAYVEALLSDHIADAESTRGEASIHLVASLFRHSKLVRASRWACELALARAHPTMLPVLISCCDRLEPNDARALLLSLRDADRDTLKEREAAARAACGTLSRVSEEPLPTDVVLAGLWNGAVFGGDALPTTPQSQIFERLRELPVGEYRDRDFWDQLGAEQRETWRTDLLEAVAGHDELKHGLIDFSCRWLDQVAFIEIEPVLIKLVDSEGDLATVRHLADRGPRLVELRAKGLVRQRLGIWAQASVEAIDSSLPDIDAKTWLGDPATEKVIHQLFARFEAGFCADYVDDWGADEEVLTARLLTGAEAAAREATSSLRALAGTTKGRFPSLTVHVRQPGKAEEGTPTAAGAPLGADILFITRVLDRMKPVVERATLVQVKKRRGKAGSKGFEGRIAFDRQQCADLLTQTEHAFYLFLTPPAPAPRLWVAPARLVRNLTELHDSRASVAAVQARDASCSFADFFLYQLVGLWAGDESQALIEIAQGDASRGRRARHVVEIQIQRGGD
jgi:hypothetical protein